MKNNDERLAMLVSFCVVQYCVFQYRNEKLCPDIRIPYGFVYLV